VKAVVVSQPSRVDLRDVPMPDPGPHQVRVRTLAGGLCGTDRHIVEGTFYRSDYPAILGHESIGEVVEAGDRVRHLKPGDLVLRTAAARPGERIGDVASMLGGFAEWGLATDVRAQEEDGAGPIAPYDRLQKVVPADFDPVDAGAFIVFKETLSALRQLGDVRGRRVLVVGTGPAGLAFVQAARLDGAAQVLVLGRREARLARARTLGADEAFVAPADRLADRVRELTDGQGLDVVIEAAGTVNVLEALPGCLARNGVVGVYGVSAAQSATFNWGWGLAVPRSWSLRFVEPDEAGIHDEALDLVSTGRQQLKSTLTHVLPFAEFAHAYDIMVDDDAGKVAIDFRDGVAER
jgi:threonine dehydrogenase-like Zn-dependent dehydrogenase